jgi:hypothetical protein
MRIEGGELSSLVPYSEQQIVLLNEEERQKLYERAKEQRSKKTPPKYIKNKGGYDYAEFAYMLDEMDKAHPIRSEIITTDEFNEKYLVYRVAVRVTDLASGEARSGVDSHPIVAYDAKSEGGSQKDIPTIRELMGNAYKAALSKALRNAYSNFGVSADLYQTFLDDEPTKEQNHKFWEWDKFIDEKVATRSASLKEWWLGQICKEWDLQTKQTADQYLKSLEDTMNNLKEKYV